MDIYGRPACVKANPARAGIQQLPTFAVTEAVIE